MLHARGRSERTRTRVFIHQPERKAQLDHYAQRHGQDPVTALDDVLATYLAWEEEDYREPVEGIRQGYTDFKTGRSKPDEQVYEELGRKHGLPR